MSGEVSAEFCHMVGFFHRDGVNLTGRLTDTLGFVTIVRGVAETRDGVRGWAVYALVTEPPPPP
jgi:hypothetical protein